MPQVNIQGQPTDHIQSFIKIGIENQLRIIIKWAGEYETLEHLEEDQRELQEFNRCL